MATYARVLDGIVAELFTPPDGVPIEDCFHADLTWIDCSATPDVAPGWTATETGGVWTFAPPADPAPPTLPEQAMALLTTPITVTSRSQSSVNGVYPNDDPTRSQITAIMTKVNAGNGLPGGSNSFNWPDIDGTRHDWRVAQFTDYANQMADFVYQAVQVQQGQSTTLPSTSLSIA